MQVACLLFRVNMFSFKEEDIYEKKALNEQPASIPAQWSGSELGRETKNETHPQDNRAA
jgi:hypothetical protein